MVIVQTSKESMAKELKDDEISMIRCLTKSVNLVPVSCCCVTFFMWTVICCDLHKKQPLVLVSRKVEDNLRLYCIVFVFCILHKL